MTNTNNVIRKYCLLTLTILLFVACFVVAWYEDKLFNLFFILYFPVYFILFGWFVALLVLNIVFIIKQKEYINFIGLAVLVILVVMILFFPFRYAKVNVELTLFDRDRTKIVEMIKNGDLQEKYSGNIDLPSGYRKLSSDGEVHVYRNDEEGQVIGFWVFRGMMSSYTHLMYSSGGEDLIRKSVGWDTEILRLDELKENWYYVVME